MSHFTKLETKLTDTNIVKRVANELGYSIFVQATYMNPYSKEIIANATIIGTSPSKPVLILTDTGDVIVDEYYMGTDWKTICQRYSEEKLKETAMMYGYEVITKKEDDITIVEVII